MKRNYIDIKWPELFGPIGGLGVCTLNRIRIEREIIPIIFIPGIMGSRLRRSGGDKAIIWDPDDTNFMATKFGLKTATAANRRALLIGSDFKNDYAEVDNLNPKHNKVFESQYDRNRARRGWGGVMWGSYGRFLVNLQQHQWPGLEGICFEFPVHAFGYNWTASNDDNGARLATYLQKTITHYQSGGSSPDHGKRMCNKVILVTHSMGGLVARSACILHGAESKVLGVVHGVQPAAGSPAAYWRMKAGFERPKGGPHKEWWDWLRNPLKMAKHHLEGHISAVVLGTDGEEVTSLLGNSPGGLELLPTKDYRDNEKNKAWLEYPAAEHKVKLPVNDPYTDIYPLRGVAYRLVNPQWLNPQEAHVTQHPKRKSQPGAWEKYCSLLQKTAGFHRRLGTKWHHPSFQFYGTDLDSPDRIVFARAPLQKLGPQTADCHPNFRFMNKGAFRMWVNNFECELTNDSNAAAVISLESGGGKGDGTVPESSAKILSIGEDRTERIGVDKASWFDLGHQDIFGTTAAQSFVYDSINSLASVYVQQHTIKKS